MMKTVLSCLLVSVAATGMGFVAPPIVPLDDDILTADEYVLATWITQGILLDVQTLEQDLFAFTLEYREEMSGHSLRDYLRAIDDMTLQSAKSTSDGVTREVYHLRQTAPDIDGPSEDMPDLVGRLIREGHRRVVDEFGRPSVYTGADFEDAPQVQASTYYRQLMERHDGDALAFMRRFVTEDMLVTDLFADYEGVDVARLYKVWPPSFESRFCFQRVGGCNPGGGAQTRLTDPLVEYLLHAQVKNFPDVMRKSDGLSLSRDRH